MNFSSVYQGVKGLSSYKTKKDYIKLIK